MAIMRWRRPQSKCRNLCADPWDEPYQAVGRTADPSRPAHQWARLEVHQTRSRASTSFDVIGKMGDKRNGPPDEVSTQMLSTRLAWTGVAVRTP